MEILKRNRLLRVVMVAVLLVGLASCSAYRDIRVTSCDVVSFRPKGLTAVEAVLGVGVENPAPDLSLTDIRASLVFAGKPCAVITAEPVTLDGRVSKVYEVPCTVSLTGDVPIVSIISALGGGDISSFTLDGSALVSTGKGKGRRVEVKGLKVDSLIRGIK